MNRLRYFSLIILVIFAFTLAGCEDATELGENEVRVKVSASSLVGTHYEDVVEQLEVWGFTNIETEAVYDIIWGITKEGTTKSVKIGGSESFSSGDIYDKDVSILVKYSMKASSDPSKQTFDITWKNEDGTIIKTDEVLWGQNPSYTGDTPQKESINEVRYIFSGWSPEITEVKGDQTYVALFTEVQINFNEVEVKDSKSVLIGKHYEEVVDKLQEWGFTNIELTPVYDIIWGITAPGTTKNVSIDGSENYQHGDIFDKEVLVVVTYSMRASDDPTKQKHTITWQYEDGTIIKTDEVLWGQNPSYTGDTPQKESINEVRYIFSGWSPEITEVKGEQTYVAIFTEEDNDFTITWKNDDGNILEIDSNVMYGTLPTYSGSVPTKTEDTGFTYEFDKWSPEIHYVNNNQTYTAQFKAIPKSFTIIILDWDDSEIMNELFDFGDIIDEPTLQERQGYILDAWISNDEKVSFPHTVSGPAIIKATYKEILPNEMLFEIYKEAADGVSSFYDEERESILFIGENNDSYSSYFKTGVYYIKVTTSNLIIEVLIDLTDSTILYKDNMNNTFMRDFLFRSYAGNVSLADYYYIEAFFEMLLNFEGSEVQAKILERYGQLLKYSDFNPNWNDLLSQTENRYDHKVKEIIDQLQLIVNEPILIDEEGVYDNGFFVINNSNQQIVEILFNIRIVDANNQENVLYDEYEIYQGNLWPNGGIGKHHDIPISIINDINIEYMIIIEIIDIRLG